MSFYFRGNVEKEFDLLYKAYPFLEGIDRATVEEMLIFLQSTVIKQPKGNDFDAILNCNTVHQLDYAAEWLEESFPAKWRKAEKVAWLKKKLPERLKIFLRYAQPEEREGFEEAYTLACRGESLDFKKVDELAASFYADCGFIYFIEEDPAAPLSKMRWRCLIPDELKQVVEHRQHNLSQRREAEKDAQKRACALSMLNYYGIFDIELYCQVLKKCFGQTLKPAEAEQVLDDLLWLHTFEYFDQQYSSVVLMDFDVRFHILEIRSSYSPFIPDKEILLRHEDDIYDIKSAETFDIMEYLLLKLVDPEQFNKVFLMLCYHLKLGESLDSLLELFEKIGLYFDSKEDAAAFARLFSAWDRVMPKWTLFGHSTEDRLRSMVKKSNPKFIREHPPAFAFTRPDKLASRPDRKKAHLNLEEEPFAASDEVKQGGKRDEFSFGAFSAEPKRATDPSQSGPSDTAAVPKVLSFKPGRNTLCSCGSGKKYKDCCGKKPH